MIHTTRHGFYKLIETKNNIKILYLDNDIFAWPELTFGDMLVTSHRIHKTDCLLSMGRYNLYAVNNEPGISDNMHLELEAGVGIWQGYLLLNGLPDSHKIRVRIIPTHEIITGSPRFRLRSDLKSNLAKTTG